MSMSLAMSSGPDRGDVLRWGMSLAVILALHIGGTIMLTSWKIAVEPAEPLPAAVMIELAPVPTSVAEPLTDLPPGPQQTEAEPPAPIEPEPEIIEPLEPLESEPEIVELAPAPVEIEPIEEPVEKAEVVVDPKTEVIERPIPEEAPIAKTKPKLKPVKTVTREKRKEEPDPDVKARVKQTTAPKATLAPPSPVAAAPAPAASLAQPSNARVTWEGALLAHLDRHKRYPRSAERRKQEGVPYVRITINRQGDVLSVRLDRSSEYAALDEEATELPTRASPLPPPPADMAGERIEVIVPVQFFISR